MKITDVKKLIPICIKAKIPLFLWGVSGIGKTALVRQWCEENHYNLLVWSLSLKEPGDILGCPYISSNETSTAPPAELPKEGNWIVFMDEMNRARVDTLNAAFKFVDDEIPGYRRPSSVFIMAAGNPSEIIRDETGKKQQAYQVTELDPALLARFLHINVEPTANEWISYAEKTKHDTTIIDFVKGYQETLGYAKISLPPLLPRARGMSFLSELRKAGLNSSEVSLEFQGEVASGLIGIPMASAFTTFIVTNQSYVKFKDLLENFEPNFVIFKKHIKEERTDLINRALTSMENYLFELEQDISYNEGKTALKLILALSKDMQVAIMHKLYKRSSKVIKTITDTKDKKELEQIVKIREELKAMYNE